MRKTAKMLYKFKVATIIPFQEARDFSARTLFKRFFPNCVGNFSKLIYKEGKNH